MTEINSASKRRSRFWKIFAKLLMSNVPIAESPEIVGKSADEETKAVLPDIIAESLQVAGKSADEETKAVLPDIINEIKQGNKLSDSLKKFNTVFTNLEILVITTAEKDNHIAECANGLGDILDEFGFPDKNEERKNTRSNYWKMYTALIDLGNTIVNTMPVAAEWADEKIRETTDAMLNEINSGSDISTTLEIRPDAFTKLELEIVRAGERTGNLDKAIKSLQPVIRMIEETDSETVKRKVFWNELGFFLMLTALPLNEILEISLNFADDNLKAMSEEILKKIAQSGYDNEEFSAPHDVYASLPSCCQYDRDKTDKAVNTAVKAETHHQNHHATANEKAAQSNGLTAVFDAYFLVKDASVCRIR